MDEGQEDVQRFSLAVLQTAIQAPRSPAEGGVLAVTEAGMLAVTSPSTLPGECGGKGAQEPRGMVRMLLEHAVPQGE